MAEEKNVFDKKTTPSTASQFLNKEDRSLDSFNQKMDLVRARLKPIQKIQSACSGAILTSLFMTPLDVVKIRLQAQKSPTATAAVELKGTVDGLLKIGRAEGVRGLWAGLSPTLVLALPSTAIYFLAYEEFKRFLRKHHRLYLTDVSNTLDIKYAMPAYIPTISGMSARICTVTVVSPLELVRTKMQSTKMSYRQMFETVRIVVKSHGMFGLYRGLPSTILRDVPFSGVYWSTYEALKRYFNTCESKFLINFLAGALAGAIAATITTPFDVIKTHEQIEFGHNSPAWLTNAQSTSKLSVMKRISSIHRHSGVQGVFTGLGPRLIRIAPSCAVMISTFEYSKEFFYKHNMRKLQTKKPIQQQSGHEGMLGNNKSTAVQATEKIRVEQTGA